MQKREITNSMIDNFLIVLESLKIPMEIGDHATTNTTNFHPAMEGIEDTIGNIGSAIKKGWDAFWAWLKNFLNMIKTRAVKFLTDIKAKFFGKNKRRTKKELEKEIKDLQSKVDILENNMKSNEEYFMKKNDELYDRAQKINKDRMEYFEKYHSLRKLTSDNLELLKKYIEERGHPFNWEVKYVDDFESKFTKIIEQLSSYDMEKTNQYKNDADTFGKLYDSKKKLEEFCTKVINILREEKVRDGMVDLAMLRIFIFALKRFEQGMRNIRFNTNDKKEFKDNVLYKCHEIFADFGSTLKGNFYLKKDNPNLDNFGPIPENDIKIIHSTLTNVLDIEPKIKQAAEKFIKDDKEFEEYVINYSAKILKYVTHFQNICFKMISPELPTNSDFLSFDN